MEKLLFVAESSTPPILTFPYHPLCLPLYVYTFFFFFNDWAWLSLGSTALGSQWQPAFFLYPCSNSPLLQPGPWHLNQTSWARLLSQTSCPTSCSLLCSQSSFQCLVPSVPQVLMSKSHVSSWPQHLFGDSSWVPPQHLFGLTSYSSLFVTNESIRASVGSADLQWTTFCFQANFAFMHHYPLGGWWWLCY
jgi:hypothetical protein